MSVYSYIVPIDDGAAPNPYGGVCTLAICKPNLRKIALEDDWLLGFVLTHNQEKLELLYAMKVTQVMSMKAYDDFTKDRLPIKVPDIKSNCLEKQMGDSVYDFGIEDIGLRPSVHSRCTKQMDLEGKNVLLSDYFYYFGEQSVPVPKEFDTFACINEDFKLLTLFESQSFFNWLDSQAFEPNRVYAKPHRVGIIASSTKTVQKSCCIRKQVERPFYEQ